MKQSITLVVPERKFNGELKWELLEITASAAESEAT